MSLDRRTFVKGIGIGAAGALAGCRTDAANPVRGSVLPLPAYADSSSRAYWSAVRGRYPVEADPVYLNTGGLGPATQQVLDVVAQTQRDLQRHSETGHNLLEPARVSFARFLGAEPDEICFTRNASEANSIIAGGLALQAGDEVIFETHAHPGGSFPWLNQAKLRGIMVRLFEPHHESNEENLARIRSLVTPRTKVVQVSHLTCTTGLLFPVDAIARLARERGIWFHVDGAQAVGMIPINLKAIGCDSYALSGHKWLGGPHETGALFLRRDRLEDVAATGVGAYTGNLPALPGEIEYAAAASRHEYGTRNAGLIAGLAEAARFQDEIGRERIARYGADLADTLVRELSGVTDIEMLTPRRAEMRGSMTTIRHARSSAAKLFTYLHDKHRLRCRPVTEQGLNAVRISTHVFNDVTECERVIAGVRDAARVL